MKNITFFLVSTILIFSLSSCGESMSPEEVTKHFHNNASATDYTGAAEYCDESIAQDILDMENLVSEGILLFPGEYISKVKCETKETTSSCDCIDKDEFVFRTIKLKKIDGEWKVTGY